MKTLFCYSFSLFRRLSSLILCLVLFLSFSCAIAQDRTFIAMDTAMSVRVAGATQDELVELQQLALQLEKLLSVTLQDSEVARLNLGETVKLSQDTRMLLAEALTWCAETSGTFDITVYPVVRAWGFTTGDYRIPTETEISSLIQQVDYTRLQLTDESFTLPSNMMIDLGGAAKGYLTDRMVEFIKSRNYTSALLYLGGNIYCLGTKENGSLWRIGIQDPLDPDSYFAVLSVQDRAVITSGNYERYFESNGVRYGHIFDPSTGYPVDDSILSATVITANATEGDCLSTALIVMGIEQATEWLLSHPQVEAVLLTPSAVYATSDLKESFVLKNAYANQGIEWIR